MILVDTSIWIDHLRKGSEKLATLLNSCLVYTHPFVIGELACGNLQNRKEILLLLTDLPQVSTASDAEVLFFIEEHKLMGQGIGYIDAHLLASVSLHRPSRIWTKDKRLNALASELKFEYQ